MTLSLEQSFQVLREAFAGETVDNLEQALDVACERYSVDSPALAAKVFGSLTTVSLFSHVLIRTGTLPIDGHYLDVPQGIGLLQALITQGADLGEPVTISDRSYTPLELLVASLPRKVRGEDFLPMAEFLVEHGAPIKPLFERRFGENEALEDFLRGMGQDSMAPYLAQAKVSRPSPFRRR